MSITQTGRHQATRDGWWSRRSKGAKVSILALALMALATAALALFVVFVGTSGTIEGGVFTMTISSVEPKAGDGCVIAADKANNVLTVTWTGAVEGDTCSLRGQYLASPSNSGNMLLQRYIAPEGVTVTIDPLTPCGRVWTPNQVQGAWLDITFDGTQSSITFDPQVHGVEFVRANEFNPGLCQPETGA